MAHPPGRPPALHLSLGRISLVMVAQAAITMLTSLWLIQAMIDLVLAIFGPGFSDLDFAYLVVPYFPTVIVAIFLTVIVALVLGFTGWVLAIAAAVSDSGRTPARVAIVIGVLAPLASGVYLWLAWTDLLTRLSLLANP